MMKDSVSIGIYIAKVCLRLSWKMPKRYAAWLLIEIQHLFPGSDISSYKPVTGVERASFIFQTAKYPFSCMPLLARHLHVLKKPLVYLSLKWLQL